MNDIVACTYGQFKGRALIVITDERILMLKDGWIRRNSQAVSYSTLKSVEIATHLFFCDVTFSNEGLEIRTTKIGRFSGKHMIGIVRGRIGARFSKWQREKTAVEGQDSLLNLPQPLNTPTQGLESAPEPTRTVPAPTPAITEEQAVTEAPKVPRSGVEDPLPLVEDIHFPSVEEVLPRTKALNLTDEDVDSFISHDDERDIFPEDFTLDEESSPPANGDENDFIKHLRSLESMRQDGILTDEEFQQAKRKLLDF